MAKTANLLQTGDIDVLLARGIPALSGPMESRAIDAIPSSNNEIWEHN